MRRNATLVATLLACLFPAAETWADGLVYQLPEDGMWARFTMDGAGTEADGTQVTLVGTLTVSSVGTTDVKGQKCRWIELAGDAKRNDQAFTIVDKLLVPEDRLDEGKEPLKYVIKAWRKHSQDPGGPMQVEDLEGAGAQNLDHLRPFLHGPFRDAEILEKAAVESKLGTRECAGIAASERTEQNGVVQDSTYLIRVHDDAPFGVVTWEAKARVERDGQYDGTMSLKLTLSDFGRDATSAIPEAE